MDKSKEQIIEEKVQRLSLQDNVSDDMLFVEFADIYVENIKEQTNTDPRYCQVIDSKTFFASELIQEITTKSEVGSFLIRNVYNNLAYHQESRKLFKENPVLRFEC